MKNNPIDRVISNRHADIPQDAMFDVPAVAPRPRSKSVRGVGLGTCPTCKKQKVGHIRDGDVVVWRLHYRRTNSGYQFQCDRSGTAVA